MQSLKNVLKVVLFLMLCFTASCVKPSCFVCKEKVGEKVVRSWEECDEFKAEEVNGRRWVEGGGAGPYTVHKITCE